MKKKMIWGILAVVVVAVIAVVLVKCMAPGLNMDGIYKSEDGVTLTISGDSITSDDGTYTGTMVREGFSWQYLGNRSEFVLENATLTTDAGTFDVWLREEAEKYVTIWENESDGKYFFLEK